MKRLSKFFQDFDEIEWMLIFGVIMLAFVLRWNSFDAPFERDEGEYAYSALLLRSGGVLYKDAFLQKPPMIVYTYFLGQLFGDGLWIPRVFAFMASLGVTALAFIVSLKEFGKKAALSVLCLITPMLVYPYFTGFSANTEIFMLLPLMGFVTVYVQGRAEAKMFHLFIGGILAALSLLYKPIAIWVVVFVFCVWMYEIWVAKKNMADIVSRAFAFGLGGLIMIFVVMLPVVVSGGWSSFWESVIVFNAFYAKQFGYGLGALAMNVGKMLKGWSLLFVAVTAFFVMRPARWWFWGGVLIVSLLTVYQSPIGHYYLLLVPFLAIAGAAGLSIVSEKLGISYLLLVGVVVGLMIWRVRAQFGLTPEEVSVWVYGYENPFVEALVVAEAVARVTTSDDKIFVAGSEPEILYYSKRESVSRFVITYPLIINTPVRLQYQKEAVEDLKQNLPEVIVYSRLKFSGLWDETSPRDFIDYLNGLIDEKYTLVGAYVWDRGGGHWEENLGEVIMESSSLLVYKMVI